MPLQFDIRVRNTLSPLGPAEWLFFKKIAWQREGGFKREKV